MYIRCLNLESCCWFCKLSSCQNYVILIGHDWPPLVLLISQSQKWLKQLVMKKVIIYTKSYPFQGAFAPKLLKRLLVWTIYSHSLPIQFYGKPNLCALTSFVITIIYSCRLKSPIALIITVKMQGETIMIFSSGQISIMIIEKTCGGTDK